MFGIDVENWTGKGRPSSTGSVRFPLDSINDIPAGTYTVQALLHRYETFKRATGTRSSCQWTAARASNGRRHRAISTRRRNAAIDPRTGPIDIALDQIIPPIEPPKQTQNTSSTSDSERAADEFWGRPMHLGANVLLPEGWDTHPTRATRCSSITVTSRTLQRLPEEPPDPNLKPDYTALSARGLQPDSQQYAHQFYKDWTGPDFPRAIVIEIQHPTPFYDDSYAVNSANVGPYGDAIVTSCCLHRKEISRHRRRLGTFHVRRVNRRLGSDGGADVLPGSVQRRLIACPDPIDFRAYTVVDIYKDKNAYYLDDTWKKTPRPGLRNYLGHVSSTLEEMNRLELVLGTKTRSGQQWDVWEATYSPVGPDGYPARIFDKRTGVIDKRVAEYWRDNYDLSYILRRDWEKGLGQKLAGKLHIYVGDMDNYYLNNAVYLVEEFLESTTNPHYGGEIDYGDRAEHCWNGDQTRPNALSRLRYHQMFIPKAVDRMLKTAPAGADLKSWRY